MTLLHAHTHTRPHRLADTVTGLRESERTSRDLATRLEEVQLARSTAENDVTIEKQWRASLQVLSYLSNYAIKY